MMQILLTIVLSIFILGGIAGYYTRDTLED